MSFTINIQDPSFRARDIASFATVEVSDGTGSTADIFLHTPEKCDELIKAVVAAKSMLLGETSEPVPQGDKPLCGEAKAGVGGVMCTRPADHAGGHKHEYSGTYWPRHDGGSEDLDAALQPPGYSLPAGELTEAALNEDICDAKSVDGLTCTRLAGHDGQHVAHGLTGNVCGTWPQDAPAKADAR